MSHRPGDVVVVDMGIPAGHEQAGVRPAIFLHAEGNVAIVIPLSTNPKRLRFLSTLMIEPDVTNGLARNSVALIFQMRAIDIRRLVRSIGVLSPKDKRALRAKVRAITCI